MVCLLALLAAVFPLRLFCLAQTESGMIFLADKKAMRLCKASCNNKANHLLNSRIHVKDTDFALDQGLLPSSMRRGQIATQFAKLADLAGIIPQIFDQVIARMVSGNEQVQQLVSASFLSQSTQRNYLQHYQSRLNGSARP